jgi:hypothetical protein
LDAKQKRQQQLMLAQIFRIEKHALVWLKKINGSFQNHAALLQFFAIHDSHQAD